MKQWRFQPVNILSRFIGIVCLLAFVCVARATGPGENNESTASSPVKQAPSIVQRMTEDQLNSLIGYLLELDSIPTDLLEEINTARYRIERQKNPLPSYVAIANFEDYPACDHYTEWNEKDIYPSTDAFPNHDTTVILALQGEKEGNYFHPFPGIITSGFGWRDSTMHNGVDIELRRGDAVSAAFDGKVRFAKRHPTYGNFVIIRHPNGLETVYAHLSKIKVKAGDYVLSGQIIGLGGSTGRSTGNHLHFEVRYKHKAINPKYFISFEQERLLADTIVIKKTRAGVGAYPKNAQFHVVEKGDNFYEVAKHYGLTTTALCNLNGWPRRMRLKPGQKVRVGAINE